MTQGAGPEGLTPKFNAASKGHFVRPASIDQIRMLEKKLSRPAYTLDLPAFGRVKGCYDPKRDQQIRETIRAIQKTLAKRREMARQAFAKAQLKNKAKIGFNRASGIRT